TVTEINDYLRLLYARIGVTVCHSCGRRVEKDTPEKIADFVMDLPEETRLYLCFPLSLEAGRAPLRKPGGKRQGPAGRVLGPPGNQNPKRNWAVSPPGYSSKDLCACLSTAGWSTWRRHLKL